MSEEHLSQKELKIRKLVWEAADRILESGDRYPTRDDICQVLRKSSHTIGKHFAEWKKAFPRSALTIQNQSKVARQANNGNGTSRAATNPDLEKADWDIQLDAARRLVARSYYEKTRNFTVPGLADQVEEAIKSIDEFAREQDETLSPLEILDWLKAKH